MSEKDVLEYPDGLDTSVMIRWIKGYKGTTFDQKWSNDFIEIWSMPTVLASARNREHFRQKTAAKATSQTLKTK